MSFRFAVADMRGFKDIAIERYLSRLDDGRYTFKVYVDTFCTSRMGSLSHVRFDFYDIRLNPFGPNHQSKPVPVFVSRYDNGYDVFIGVGPSENVYPSQAMTCENETSLNNIPFIIYLWRIDRTVFSEI
jgi:hypothetical protein